MTEQEKQWIKQQENEQNHFLQNFVDSINGSMANYIVEEDGRLIATYVSAGMGNMIGLSKEQYLELCSGDAMKCIYPEDREKIIEAIRKTIREDKPSAIALRSLTGDGGYTWLNSSYTKSGEIDGKPMIRVVFTPVTAQFEQQQDILQNIPGGISLYKWDGTKIYPVMLSKQFTLLHGGEVNTDSGKISAVDLEYVHKDDLKGYQDFLKAIVEDPGKERVHTFRFWNLRDQKYNWICVTTTDIPQNDGTLLIYATYANVDQMKEAEEKLKQNEAVLEARIRMEQERLLGGDGNLLAYLVSNINQDKVIEHKTFQQEIPIGAVGMSMEAGFQLSAETIIDPEKHQEFMRVHNRTFLTEAYHQGTNTIHLEYRRKKPDGTVIWERNVINLLCEPESGDLFIYEYCYDINKERLLEETMLAAVNYDYERFGSINLEEDQISMLIPDPVTQDYHLKIERYSELCRNYAAEHVYEEDREYFLANVLPEAMIERLEETGSFELTHRELDAGGNLTYKRDRHAYYDRDKKICLLTRSDITDAVQAEEKKQEQLRESLEKEKKALQAKSDFLSRMSHELRTPLNAIEGYATLLEQSISSKEDEERLEAIHKSTKYLLAIIGDILDTQKIEQGRIELHKESVNAAEYMQTIVEMIRPEAASKQIDFSYERLTSMNEAYYIDGIRFQQVLLNLLHNAVKFTPAGGTVRMTAETIQQENHKATLQFKVSDTGIGMSREFIQEHLYQAFTQENQGMTSPYEGTGIGLSICNELVKLMDGSITCDSVKGNGTTFTVTITADVVDQTEAAGHRRHREHARINYDLGGLRILLCEDNKMNQDMTKSLLGRMNCQVEVADDGQIGKDKFAESVPAYYDLILMDLRMPVMDGFQATEAIRELPRDDAKCIPILALSANAFEEDVRKSLQAGMNEHLAKPVDARVLFTKIKQYCMEK